MALTVKELMEAIIHSCRTVDLESEVIVAVQGQAKTKRIIAIQSEPGWMGLADGSLILVVE